MGDSKLGLWVGLVGVIGGFALAAVGWVTNEHGTDNVLVFVGAGVAICGGVLGCYIDNLVNKGRSEAVALEAPPYLEPQPKKKAALPPGVGRIGK